MDARFWHQKWQRGDLGFHQPQANPLLVRHCHRLRLAPGSRILLPLCGMTLDISWLLAQGFRVAGVELSQVAVDELLNRLNLEPHITQVGSLRHHRVQDIDLFVGDIFEVSADWLGPVDAIYDRAALVALPDATRQRYASHLIRLTDTAPQLLITYEYDQSQMAGPPFSVPQPAIERLYGAAYQLQSLERQAVAGGFKGKVAAIEAAWLLQPKR
ncbi:Thiopurine S-methyltransferase [Halomicronema hongdechloris C2206]|uniref:Thiopurine S-methyltransferase n=2 Tax=Halomicronema hongdechloris TaxID=1209493 RepID=A0A1Z3HT80_9CYAN|nr:Thiopurine S-methyltransferase [Halomicronema hongdechloris C2206]